MKLQTAAVSAIACERTLAGRVALVSALSALIVRAYSQVLLLPLPLLLPLLLLLYLLYLLYLLPLLHLPLAETQHRRLCTSTAMSAAQFSPPAPGAASRSSSMPTTCCPTRR